MKRSVLGFLFLVLATGSAFAAGQNSTMITSDDTKSDDCSEHLRMYNDAYQASVRDEEVRTVPNQPLTITAEHNGGISVTSWDKPEFSIKLCKQVAARDEAQARQVLSGTHLEIAGDKVTITVPDRDAEDRYSLGTLLLIKAPKNATVDLSVRNGGVSLSDFTGTAQAHAVNGGIALTRASGKILAEARNGGVSIKQCGGEITANVQNGGVALSLAQQWEGKGLEAHTQNGGLSISVPKNFNSNLEVSGSYHTNIICEGSFCNNSQRNWDEEHRILRIGSGTTPQIRATTVNGGIVVKEVGYHRADM